MGQDAFLLAIDQGTTSTRSILFDGDGSPIASAARDLPQIYPRDGWVEHDPERILEDTVATLRDVLARAGVEPDRLAGIGITNQRETVVVWDRETGRPVYNAIVWQDRRTADRCRALARAGHGPLVQERTGLLLDPYFSATKLAWILEHVPGARALAQEGRLAFGTIDTWLLYRLSGGTCHATDATNAARTMLFDIRTGVWDPDLLALFDVPAAMMPDVLDCDADFATLDPAILGRPVRLRGVAGDQQAATIGQACFEPGLLKSTYGTGCFALVNTGDTLARSSHRLLTTIAYRIGGETAYALEGSIFVAGAAVQWLRDQLGAIASSPASAEVAAGARDDDDVYLVPAFVGLGAPYWDPDARGAILGLTRDTGAAEIVRAGLDAVAFQTRDLMDAMDGDMPGALNPVAIRADGGMAANDWFLQRLSDLTQRRVERPAVIETTALGAAYLAGLRAGMFGGLEDVGARWHLDRVFEPAMTREEADRRYAGWQAAVSRVLTQ
ncbi:MAG: glycerol kinase GlpK [Alphaproteobacteria bacterium]